MRLRGVIQLALGRTVCFYLVEFGLELSLRLKRRGFSSQGNEKTKMAAHADSCHRLFGKTIFETSWSKVNYFFFKKSSGHRAIEIGVWRIKIEKEPVNLLSVLILFHFHSLSLFYTYKNEWTNPINPIKAILNLSLF